MNSQFEIKKLFIRRPLKLVFLFWCLLFLNQTTQAYSITTQTGYEISGFTNRIFKNPDYESQPIDGFGQHLRHKTSARELHLFQNDKELEYVYFSDQRFPSVNDVSSIILEGGKIKSQINCLNPELNDGRSCYVVTDEVCRAVLVNSGKKDFNQFLNEVRKCNDVLNIYSKSIESGPALDSIAKTYSDHSLFMNKLNSRPKNFIKYAFPEIFGSIPQLKSAGSVEHINDFRLLGLINTCSNYLSNNQFVERSNKIEPSAGKDKNLR
jgi:hypothetical protein